MKRTPKVEIYRIEDDIVRVKSIFSWHKCEKCKLEFRREYGWEYTYSDYHFSPSNYFSKYICGSCAPTIEDAARFFSKGKTNVSSGN